VTGDDDDGVLSHSRFGFTRRCSAPLDQKTRQQMLLLMPAAAMQPPAAAPDVRLTAKHCGR